jgi:hypothetical protein
MTFATSCTTFTIRERARSCAQSASSFAAMRLTRTFSTLRLSDLQQILRASRVYCTVNGIGGVLVVTPFTVAVNVTV